MKSNPPFTLWISKLNDKWKLNSSIYQFPNENQREYCDEKCIKQPTNSDSKFFENQTIIIRKELKKKALKGFKRLTFIGFTSVS